RARRARARTGRPDGRLRAHRSACRSESGRPRRSPHPALLLLGRQPESYACRMQWAPRTAETALAGVGAVAAAAAAVTLDPAGRLLLGLAALCLAALTVGDLVLRPRLRADSAGLEVRRLDGRRRLPWSAVREVRVDVHSRYGLAARTLEVDTGDEL